MSNASVSARIMWFRIWLANKWALLRLFFGRRTGYFVRYAYRDGNANITSYSAIEKLCEAAEYSAIFAVLREERPEFEGNDFWRETTDHLGFVDSAIDYAVVRWARPNRILEIGSGRSTHVLTRAVLANGQGDICCIDPAPRLDISSLPVAIERRPLAIADVARAAQLRANDILFIDSSHIAFEGTDVDIELNMMLPELASGVLVHLHDIHLPYRYRPDWAEWHWNEAQALAPWILSGAFEILIPTNYLCTARPELLHALLPDFAETGAYAGGSFWLRKR